MKKIILTLLIIVGFTQQGFAESLDVAQIKLKLNGALRDNRYFLCLSGIGCLSVLAATKGKTYPVMHTFDMSTIYMTNFKNDQIYAQNLPASCHVSVNTNQTITISGNIVEDSNNAVHINHLRCSVS